MKKRWSELDEAATGAEPTDAPPMPTPRDSYPPFVVLPMLVLLATYSSVLVGSYWKNHEVIWGGDVLLAFVGFLLSVVWFFQKFCAARLLGNRIKHAKGDTRNRMDRACIYVYTTRSSGAPTRRAAGMEPCDTGLISVMATSIRSSGPFQKERTNRHLGAAILQR